MNHKNSEYEESEGLLETGTEEQTEKQIEEQVAGTYDRAQGVPNGISGDHDETSYAGDGQVENVPEAVSDEGGISELATGHAVEAPNGLQGAHSADPVAIPTIPTMLDIPTKTSEQHVYDQQGVAEVAVGEYNNFVAREELEPILDTCALSDIMADQPQFSKNEMLGILSELCSTLQQLKDERRITQEEHQNELLEMGEEVSRLVKENAVLEKDLDYERTKMPDVCEDPETQTFLEVSWSFLLLFIAQHSSNIFTVTGAA